MTELQRDIAWALCLGYAEDRWPCCASVAQAAGRDLLTREGTVIMCGVCDGHIAMDGAALRAHLGAHERSLEMVN